MGEEDDGRTARLLGHRCACGAFLLLYLALHMLLSYSYDLGTGQDYDWWSEALPFMGGIFCCWFYIVLRAQRRRGFKALLLISLPMLVLAFHDVGQSWTSRGIQPRGSTEPPKRVESYDRKLAVTSATVNFWFLSGVFFLVASGSTREP